MPRLHLASLVVAFLVKNAKATTLDLLARVSVLEGIAGKKPGTWMRGTRSARRRSCRVLFQNSIDVLRRGVPIVGRRDFAELVDDAGAFSSPVFGGPIDEPARAAETPGGFGRRRFAAVAFRERSRR